MALKINLPELQQPGKILRVWFAAQLNWDQPKQWGKSSPSFLEYLQALEYGFPRYITPAFDDVSLRFVGLHIYGLQKTYGNRISCLLYLYLENFHKTADAETLYEIKVFVFLCTGCPARIWYKNRSSYFVAPKVATNS